MREVSGLWTLRAAGSAARRGVQSAQVTDSGRLSRPPRPTGMVVAPWRGRPASPADPSRGDFPMRKNPLLGRTLRLALPVAAALAFAAGPAAADDIKIGHIYSKSGPLEAYGKQTATGFNMGLEYATGGTMEVNGRKLVVIEKDDKGKPDEGKALLAEAYGDDDVDIAVGPTSS